MTVEEFKRLKSDLYELRKAITEHSKLAEENATEIENLQKAVSELKKNTASVVEMLGDNIIEKN